MQRQQYERVSYSILLTVIFVIGFLPRLLMLDAFLTPDEFAWVGRSRDFLSGILSRNWAGTLQSGHPGVTTMWTGSLGILYRYWTRSSSAPDDLLAFVQGIPNHPIQVAIIAPMRFPTVVLTSLAIIAFFWLAARCFDRRTALIAAGLLALDPFYLSLSRVLHQDALATTFMTLSLLPMLGYWVHGWRRRWLLASGMMAGLAFLSKSSAMLLMPFCAVVGVWTCILRWRRDERTGWQATGQLVLDGVLWGAVAWLTYGAVWPAMWVEPIAVLSKVFGFVEEHVSEGHLLGAYFLGHFTLDPGPLFYPLTWLLRATPLNLLAPVALLAKGSRPANGSRPEEATDNRQRTTIYLLLVYVLFNVVILTLGAKKQDRYILPIFPALDLLAGLGLMRLWQIATNLMRRGSRLSYPLWVAGAIIGQAIFSLPYAPYYLTYYNPLLGGGPTAEKLVTVGWGEGLDLAAAYLNQKPNADQLKVITWYYPVFAPYFRGQADHFFTIGKDLQMSSNYLVFYQNQLQREMPDPDLQAYYLRHHTPEYVANLKGVDYALVYAVPIERHINRQSSQVAGKLILYGYRQVGAPGVWTIQLVWENRGLPAEDGLWAALQRFEGPGQPPASQTMNWQACVLAPGFSPAEAQKVGAVVESTCELSTGDLGPGVYSLHVGLGPAGGSQGTTGVVDLLAPGGDVGVSVPREGVPSLITSHEALNSVAKETLPPGASPLHVSYGGKVALIGYEVAPPSPQAGQSATVTLYWRALVDVAQPASLAQSFLVRFDLIAPDGSRLAGTTDKMLTLAKPGDGWRQGAVLADPHPVRLPDNLPAGEYRLSVGLSRADTGQLVPFLDDATGLLTADQAPLDTIITVK